MQYRADIDGLRAIAVLPVVLFHAGYPAFSGGYVGVDVFFVISGFLITSILVREIDDNRFSIVNFYERRIRRIFPALFPVVLFSWVGAALVLLPLDFKDFSQSVAATALFVSNFLFWKESDYFERAAETKPLLHTWSLSVEEQFYIAFPLLLWLLRARSKSFSSQVIGALAVISFVLSVVLVTDNPEAAFFLSASRAWELFLGAMLALVAVPRLGRWVDQVLGFCGLGLIAWSVSQYSALTPFPGINAIAPCLGAMFIILSGRQGQTATGRLLGSAPFVFIGKISYSLYLWHWPLIVLTRHRKLDALTTFDRGALIAASIIAAALSWRFVEKPFRGSASMFDRRKVFSLAAAMIVGGVGLGLIGQILQGWPQRFSAEMLRLAGQDTPWTLGQDCPAAAPCPLGTPGAEPDIFIWGDSHADAIAPIIDRLAKKREQGAWLYTRPGCLPVVGLRRRPDNTNCGTFAEDILNTLLAGRRGRTIVLVGRWSRIIEGETDPSRSRDIVEYTDERQRRLSKAEQQELLVSQIEVTVHRLIAHGDVVVLVSPIPEHIGNVPEMLTKRLIRGLDPDNYFLPLEAHVRRNAIIVRLFESLAMDPRVTMIRLEGRLCPDGRCSGSLGGEPLYLDGDHVSPRGAELIETLFEESIEKSVPL